MGRPRKMSEETIYETEATTAVAEKPTEPIKAIAGLSTSSLEDNPVYRAWKRDSKMVRGVFRCHEPRGGTVVMSYKQYKWDPTRTYTFVDGQEYEIPLGLAKHLNTNCAYPVHQHILGPDGNPLVDRSGRKVSRMNFESLEFFHG